jgi:hypothetical protein
VILDKKGVPDRLAEPEDRRINNKAGAVLYQGPEVVRLRSA